MPHSAQHTVGSQISTQVSEEKAEIPWRHDHQIRGLQDETVNQRRVSKNIAADDYDYQSGGITVDCVNGQA